MGIEVLNTYSGPNVYCDSPALHVSVSPPQGLVLQDTALGERIYLVLEEFLNTVGQSSNYVSLKQLPEPQSMELPELHVWLFRALSEALDMLPETISITARDANSYQLLVSWKVVEGITVGLLSFTLGFVANVAKFCQAGTVDLLNNLDLPARLDEFGHKKHAATPDISAELIIRECQARGIPVLKFMNNNRCLQLGHGRKRIQIIESASSNTSVIAQNLSTSKVATTTLLRRYGVPAPTSTMVGSAEQAAQVAARSGYPVVVKPNGGGKGVGITVGVRNESELSRAFQKAQGHGSGVLVENVVPGEDHRILVVDYKMVNVAKRMPAAVRGDGASTVAELIESENRNPLRGDGYEKAMNKILIDDEVHRMLSRQGLSLETVSERDCQVQLRGNANISTGGTAEDKTAVIHPDNQRAAETAARLLGIKLVGVDFISPDISCSYREVGGGICELNVGPGIPIHDIGKEQSCVAGPVVDSYFGEDDGRIPVAVLEAQKNTSGIAGMLAQILAIAGYGVGRATREGLWIGSEQYESTSCTDINSTMRLLVDPLVEAAILEAEAGLVLQHGLGIDRAAVSLVTGVNDSAGSRRVGQTTSPESVIARSAAVLAVLNADDTQCLALREDLSSEHVCFVSQREEIPEQAMSLAQPGDFFCLLCAGRAEFRCGGELLLEVSEAELRGELKDARQLLSAILYAIPLAYGMGLAPDTIKAAILQCSR